ncbi:MAG: hypothetical protein KGJ62_13775 [Armatimonadetes bacterium]|nr:hypothetical protein [Armatimonadota bacterium]MDE2207636.1 hypothetical protein [Armatimonadota bacterium]
MTHIPDCTALQNTCILETPDPVINAAFRFAKDNIARCMRWYTLGWGMSNAPHNYAIVVGRDTAWMGMGIDYVAPWFTHASLAVFRDRQKANGMILEYVDMERGVECDYGLNISDNTPLYILALAHHAAMHGPIPDYAASVERAADHILSQIGAAGLVEGVAAGVETSGIFSWRNIIPGGVIAGAVTELNTLCVAALRGAAEFCEAPHYAAAADTLEENMRRLETANGYLLALDNGAENASETGDMLFPPLFNVGDKGLHRAILARMGRDAFWGERGMRTVPRDDPAYDPSGSVGLLGGSWPNLTLWYAAAAARHDPDRALDALLRVARTAAEPQPETANVNITEFAEVFHGETGVNIGMRLSPWVAPTFIWAVVEGLLGARWHGGRAIFRPCWPDGWSSVSIRRLPTQHGFVDLELVR